MHDVGVADEQEDPEQLVHPLLVGDFAVELRPGEQNADHHLLDVGQQEQGPLLERPFDVESYFLFELVVDVEVVPGVLSSSYV